MSDRIERAVELAAPVDRVWRALTDPTEFGAWFGVKVETPFVCGHLATGRSTHPGYEHLRWEVTVVAMETQRLFAFTWHPYAVDPAVDYSGETPTRVDFHLEPAGGGTKLTIVETGFDAVPGARRDEALRMNGQGWTAQVDNIRAHLDG